MNKFDVIIIGGGQAGLSVAYFLNRHGLKFLILDDNQKAGGAWNKAWDSLQLFSPGVYSSLSGWMLPPPEKEYPTKKEFISYLEKYEKRYNFPIERPVKVEDTVYENGLYRIKTNKGEYLTKAVVGATGTASGPKIPQYEGIDSFLGQQLHSVDYQKPSDIQGDKLLIVGGGNSGAQLVAELTQHKKVQWATLSPPNFLPDDVDGRHLFEQANKKYREYLKGEISEEAYSISDIVMLDSVKDARERGVLNHRPSTFTFTSDGVIWEDGTHEQFDTVLWCTGFSTKLDYLSSLNIVENEKVKTKNTKVLGQEGLWLVGMGNWTGYASATIYGVGKTARRTVEEIVAYILQ
ncbi:ArsO family NAD(P)H-dependent flavin-containing monooxygenase [Flammeovirga sp. SJP92]|uniref:ArsO family NAD(P)H-dependent flavin-containing monooxygenase n=1 Tax=Flammeovirga sp. SJP92 TaxID=1775430 RepID=UPI0007879440|nr:ArsO family NAD(P)H-dependent flavin-containing monooxygenase [Flammeovirga sp. SJP92]KXX72507.1 pyridine nucleotide-disulfide oxidoreductase [Flammeovirga sp. SJP92]